MRSIDHQSVVVRRARLSARIPEPPPDAARAVESAVSAEHRDNDPITGELIIFGSAVTAAVDALQRAGFAVVESGGAS